MLIIRKFSMRIPRFQQRADYREGVRLHSQMRDGAGGRPGPSSPHEQAAAAPSLSGESMGPRPAETVRFSSEFDIDFEGFKIDV